VLVTVPIVFISILISVLAAYALSRLGWLCAPRRVPFSISGT
jgi:ABC-type glycerol-3-phosphate transport system permease component